MALSPVTGNKFGMEMEVETDPEDGHLPRARVKHKEMQESPQGESSSIPIEDGHTEKETSQDENKAVQRKGVSFTWVPNQPVNGSSFRDIVAGSSQWFKEAKQLVQASMEWEEEDVEIPDSQLAVSFSKKSYKDLESHGGIP